MVSSTFSTWHSGFRGFRVALVVLWSMSVLVKQTQAHVAAWHPAMYCLKGNVTGVDNENNNTPVNPLFQLSRAEWWFHHVDKCDEFPPDDGVFLDLPANGEFTVELAVNRAFTTLAFGGRMAGVYPDGAPHPAFEDGSRGIEPPCIGEAPGDPNIHTNNQTMAAGTAFAISYQSDLKQVTPENLVVFTTLNHTPWKRLATYKVPNLPACPEAGCICAWGWVPNGCGVPNMYMEGFRCKVTGTTGGRAIAPAIPAVWCEDDSTQCISGAKQMIFWNQMEGNNIEVSGFDLAGSPRSPAYNTKLGWTEGAQNDIFVGNNGEVVRTTSIPPLARPSATPTGTPGSAPNSASVSPLYLLVHPVFVTISVLSMYL